ncbi:hypothetical protein [uncultured Paludibaculum sp.]|uniref:hypothetical protein n=1 Tax=uncultured Paludibaculum sp. TaxID=1765020 RepID=UPI002AAB4B35|nr:hypothetical protein [uncultured Paludibaculum sp.]
MTKLTKSDQARINGARSRGPVTAEGKARSARNATKHGKYAKTGPGAAHSAVLKSEDSAAFDDLVERRARDFRPLNSFEASLVREICALEWRYDRLSAIETRHIDLQIAQETEALRRQTGSLRGVSTLDVTALGVGRLVETTRILPFCALELGRIQRARRQMLDTLIAYRKGFRPLEQSEDPAYLQQLDRWNEPSLADLELLAHPSEPTAPAALGETVGGSAADSVANPTDPVSGATTLENPGAPKPEITTPDLAGEAMAETAAVDGRATENGVGPEPAPATGHPSAQPAPSTAPSGLILVPPTHSVPTICAQQAPSANQIPGERRPAA